MPRPLHRAGAWALPAIIQRTAPASVSGPTRPRWRPPDRSRRGQRARHRAGGGPRGFRRGEGQCRRRRGCWGRQHPLASAPHADEPPPAPARHRIPRPAAFRRGRGWQARGPGSGEPGQTCCRGRVGPPGAGRRLSGGRCTTGRRRAPWAGPVAVRTPRRPDGPPDRVLGRIRGAGGAKRRPGPQRLARRHPTGRLTLWGAWAPPGTRRSDMGRTIAAGIRRRPGLRPAAPQGARQVTAGRGRAVPVVALSPFRSISVAGSARVEHPWPKRPAAPIALQRATDKERWTRQN